MPIRPCSFRSGRARTGQFAESSAIRNENSDPLPRQEIDQVVIWLFRKQHLSGDIVVNKPAVVGQLTDGHPHRFSSGVSLCFNEFRGRLVEEIRTQAFARPAGPDLEAPDGIPAVAFAPPGAQRIEELCLPAAAESRLRRSDLELLSGRRLRRNKADFGRRRASY
jgi:hypothetical protein